MGYDNTINDSQHSERLANLKKELKNLKKEEHNNTRRFMAAKDHLEGETVSKYYFQVNKESKPRDTIQALEIMSLERNPEGRDSTQEQEPELGKSETPVYPQPCYEKYSHEWQK